MFVGVPPTVSLFRHFFVLRPAEKKRGFSTADVADCCNFRVRDGLGEQFPGVDEATGRAPTAPGGDAARSRPQTSGEEAASSPAQTGGPGAAGGGPQASRGAADGSSRQAGGGGAAGSGAATAPGYKGKRPRTFAPTPTSSSSSLQPRQRPLAGGAKEAGRGGQPSGAGPAMEAASAVLEPDLDLLGLGLEPRDQGWLGSTGTASAQAGPPEETDPTAAPQSLPWKKRREDSEPKPSGPEYRIPESRWPPIDTAGDQGWPEAPRPALAPELSAPVEPEPLSMREEPEPQSAPTETEPQAPPCPEPMAEVAPEQPAPAEPAPSTSSVVPAWQYSGTPSPSKRALRGPSARPSPSRPAEPLLDVLGSAREVIERLEAAVVGEKTQLEAGRTALLEVRERLAEGRRLFEARVTAARAVNENERRVIEAEREALEEFPKYIIMDVRSKLHLMHGYPQTDELRNVLARDVAREHEILNPQIIGDCLLKHSPFHLGSNEDERSKVPRPLTLSPSRMPEVDYLPISIDDLC
ncbi:actin cytoskeleton-regulatory complex protein PAN1-like [Phragmites australis]|uniref:actin cytoskeleton-regulatory complex protein PAN1-like n=1 Tax=Phragmites australis TaxID=29695 RepID=UPI002D776949|nr:actin cytoskeleton-regulatory complex protein PAN1-like [Phragmites australis]